MSDTWSLASAARGVIIDPEPSADGLAIRGGRVGVSHWRAQTWERICTGWWVKMTATTLGIGLFFLAYFWVMRHPRFVPSVVPAIWLDHAIGFEPAALPVYFSLWLYVSLAPALLKNLTELLRFGVASVLLSLTGLAVFLFWPSRVPDFGVDWTRHPSIQFLKTVDVAGNACPSMHVAFAVFAAIWLHQVLIEMAAPTTLRWINGIWCLAIVWSTIATRQHVVYDVLAGAALGIAFAWPQWRSARMRGRPPSAR